MPEISALGREEQDDQGHPQLYSKFEASLGYVRCCLGKDDSSKLFSGSTPFTSHPAWTQGWSSVFCFHLYLN